MTIEPVDLNEITASISNWVSRVIPASIRIETWHKSGLWLADADIAMSENAILNLVINARDAMPQGGALTIETSNVTVDADYGWERGEMLEPGRYVMVAVTDTGSGISPDHLDRIFDPFFSTKAPGEGSGVGLSMVKGYMKQVKGCVRVYSEPGEGSAFKLLFPASMQTNRAELSKYRQVQRPTRDVRVLLAEDDPAVRDVLED